MMDITEMSRQEVAPATYGLRRRSRSTKAAAKRSSSLLNKPLAKDRNFLPKNVKHKMCVHYNLSTN